MPIVAFVLFDLVAVMFLLWCLLNFVREGARHRGVDVKVMRLDPMQARRKANIFALRRREFSRQERHDRITRFARSTASMPARRIEW